MSSSENTTNTAFDVSEDGPKKPFKLPKWKKIIGDEHIVSNWDLEYDLLSIEEFMNNMLSLGWCPLRVCWGTRFSFVPCEPGEFICRSISSVKKSGSFDKEKAEELGDLLTADGARIIPQENTWGSQIGLIALRSSALGPFEITSDLDSSIAEYEARKKFGEGIAGLFLVVGFLWLASGLLDIVAGGSFALIVVWLVLACAYYRPVPRYKKILKRLYAQRDISEI